jgi:hypothetical protein
MVTRTSERSEEKCWKFATRTPLDQDRVRWRCLARMHRTRRGPSGLASGKVYTLIRKVLDSKLGWYTDYILSDIIRASLQSLQANDKIVSRLDHNRFLPDPFQFINHPNV